MSGNATYLAAIKVRDNILTKASEIFGVDKSELIIEDEKIKTKDGKSISLRDIAVACAADGVELFYEAQFNAPFGEVPDPETGQGRVFPDFTYGTAGAIVEIDTETGEVEVKKIASAFDVGTAINPMRVEGQIEGGAAMGIGWALTEDVKFEKGIAKAQSFAEYIIATAVDVPEIKSIIVENHDGLGPFGARGVGEVVLAPVPPAVINAVADALGKRIKELPITGERILLALREKS
jgi:CO/xanthine dehydrogenase Mo-binding subunit